MEISNRVQEFVSNKYDWDKGFILIVYVNNNQQVKTSRLKLIEEKENGYFTLQDKQQIAVATTLIPANQYVIELNEPSFIIGFNTSFFREIGETLGEYDRLMLSGLTDLEKYCLMNDRLTPYIVENLEESDYRPANTPVQVIFEQLEQI